jgi:hypothetical protein
MQDNHVLITTKFLCVIIFHNKFEHMIFVYLKNYHSFIKVELHKGAEKIKSLVKFTVFSYDKYL